MGEAARRRASFCCKNFYDHKKGAEEAEEEVGLVAKEETVSPLLDASGRPLLQEDGGPASCVLCAAVEANPRVYSKDGVPETFTAEHARDLDQEGAYGYLVGLHLMAAVLVGSGMPPEQAAHLQAAASSLCPDHEALAAASGDRYRAPVEQAIRNIRAASVFVVGRQGGVPTGKVGP